MKWINVPLQYKILLGYLILFVVIGSMTAILFYERKRIGGIEAETLRNCSVRHDIDVAHRYIMELATLGETVMAWEESDYQEYHEKRLCTDSFLLAIKMIGGDIVCPGQIDRLRTLLKEKEIHLFRIMEAVGCRKTGDSLLVNNLSAVTRQVLNSRAVVQKKKGIAGWFGGRRSVQALLPSQELQDLNERLITVQRRREQRTDEFADSLRRQNSLLNKELHAFISYLDANVQSAFTNREREITEARSFSYRLFVLVISSASVLLVVSFLIIRHDIKKSIKVQARFQRIIRENEELLEMRKQVLLAVSHDIRGPLGNISTCAELALDTRERKKRVGYLDNILHSCRHILHLVNDLMDVYRINEAGDTLNEVPFRLDRLLDGISAGHARNAHRKALTFEAFHGGAKVAVTGDADKIERVLDNLLTNAVKFTVSGTVHFQSEYVSGRLFVTVGDTGIGMDAATLERVFRPFERAAQEVNSEGFGLGLFITQALVKVLDATMSVDSIPGKGTTFRLEFPLPETSEKPEGEEFPIQSPVLLPKRVLVVDDDGILLKITGGMLGRNGVECVTCRSAGEAVAALARSECDLVLTDLQMPVTDGFGLLKLLRGSDIANSRTVPVAVMTARGDGDSGVYLKYGFCGCLHKPFSMKGLLSFISSVTVGIPSCPFIFDYSRLLSDTDDRWQMFGLVAEESEKNLASLKCALQTDDRDAMRQTVHRMMPAWELLGTADVLSAYRSILYDTTADDGIIRTETWKIMELLEQLIAGARQKQHKDNVGKKNVIG